MTPMDEGRPPGEGAGGQQRPPEEGARRDELLADCRLRAATDLLAHTWDPVVLAGLQPGPRRRRDLLAAIGGVSDKALTEALRRLLAGGLITRHRRPAAPPHVEYALTALGGTLVEGPVRALAAWAQAHGDALLAAQEQEQEEEQDQEAAGGT
jgi:DNA-binding HxlR family transcriptional regulator